ncbi:MAG: glycosyltransferase [Nitrospinota bacterium]|nr:glycosyltransferase [Nitrospinota bacterium]
MKILHVITSLGVGGAEAMLLKLLAGLDQDKFRQSIVTLADSQSEFTEKAEAMGVQVQSLGMRPGGLSLMKLIRLVSIIRSHKPDIVQTWLYHSDLIGAIAAKLARVPAVVWNIRCSYLDRKDHPRSLFWIIWLLAKMSKIPEAVIVNSAAGRLAHEEHGYSPKRWELIQNGFNTDIFKPSLEARNALREALGLGPDTLLIGMIARYHPMKDHETFLNAAGILHQRREDVHFVLAGLGVDKDNRPLMEMIHRKGIMDKVSPLGERRNIQQIAAAMDIVTLTSYSEGFPNAIGEAMCCGVPCVAAGAGETRELIGDTGIVIPAKDPEALAAAWDSMLSMTPQERGALGQAARARIIEKYSLESVVRQYKSFYTQIAKKAES